MLVEAQRASADLSEFMGLAWRLRWDKQIRLGARVGPAGLEEARRRFHNQDGRLNDSNCGVPVRTTWAIGPTPYSTTPRQLSDALWNWSGGVGTPWKVSPLRVLPIKEGRGVGQTWLLGAGKPPPAMELTLPSGKVFVRAEMTGPRKARTDVWDNIKQQSDQPQPGAADLAEQNVPGSSSNSTEKNRGKAGKAQRPTKDEKRCKYSRTHQ